MTRPADIPPSGSPLVGLSPVLSRIAATANRDDAPPSGIFGSEGTATAPPPQCSIGLFKLTGPFVNSPPPWDNAPSSTWWFAQAEQVEYYPGDATPPSTWNTPGDQGDSETATDDQVIWAPGNKIQNATIAQSGERVWCFYDDRALAWVMISKESKYAYASAIPSSQYLSGGSSPQFVAMTGTGPNVSAGNGTTGTFEINIPGTYLILAGVSVGPGATGSGDPDMPPIVEFTATAAVNDAATVPDMTGHLHYPTSPDNTDTPWKLTIDAGDMQAVIPANSLGAGIPPAAVDVDLPKEDYEMDLPGLDGADGSVSIAKLATLAAGDQVGLFVQCEYNIEVDNGYLIVILLGP